MCSAVTHSAAGWLVNNGPRELELLFRAIVYHPSAPILVADDHGNTWDASIGVGKLLGLPREKIIGRPVGDFAPPASKREISQLWKALREQGEQEGTLRLVGPDAKSARRCVHRQRERVARAPPAGPARPCAGRRNRVRPAAGHIPAWVQDYALYLLDSDGDVAAWYSGAERIYCYRAEEASDNTYRFSIPAKRLYGAAGRTQPRGGRRPRGN